MSQFIKSIEHNNHMNHLLRVTPILVFFMGIQYLIMKNVFPQESLGNYFVFLALSLSCLICGFTVYDSYHRLLLFKDFVIIRSPYSFSAYKLDIRDLKNIHNLSGDNNFGTVVFVLKDERKFSCYFVDYPEEVKIFIQNLIIIHKSEKQLQDAA